MRILLSVILSALCCIQAMAQNQSESIYTFDEKGEIVANREFIDTHVERNNSEVMPYTLIGITTFEANSEKYELQVLNYKGWEDDGGDFRIIRLFHKGEQILEFIDEEAWIGNPLIKEKKTWIGGPSRDINSGGSHFSEFEESVSNHAKYTGHCLVYPLKDKATALLFNGFSWSSQVPLLTIIVIKDNKAKVVFNQSWGIELFKAEDKGFDLTLMANFPVYVNDDNTPDIWHPNFHRLYTTQDGSMKIEKSDLDWVEYVTKKYGKEPEDLTIYTEPDEAPMFPGGMEGLKTFISKNVRYPDYCRKNEIEGRVIVQFVINKDGSISDAEVVKSVDKFLDKEALRVISSMPTWKPGMKDGRDVRTRSTMPIIFRLP